MAMGDPINHTEDQRILEVSARLKLRGTTPLSQVWPQVASKLDPEGKILKMNNWLKVAASIALLSVFTYTVYLSQTVEVHTARGRQQEITLPDGSTVMLNAQSKISYNSIYWWFERRLAFQGEGFFKVKKGSTFSVYSSSGTTQVLGTSFNIYARKKEYKVSCTTGKVKVVLANNQSQTLTPGLEVTSLQEGLTPVAFEKNKTLAWQRGEFYFESNTLSEVFETIELQYNVNFDDQNVDTTRSYTGFFTNQDIDEALSVVCLPMGLSFSLIDTENIKIFKEENI